jgi:predicted DNA-binding protein
MYLVLLTVGEVEDDALARQILERVWRGPDTVEDSLRELRDVVAKLSALPEPAA